MMLGAANADMLIFVGVWMLSSILSAVYLFPIIGRAFFRPLPQTDGETATGIQEAPLPSVIAICVAAIGTFVLFFYAGDLAHFLSPIVKS